MSVSDCSDSLNPIVRAVNSLPQITQFFDNVNITLQSADVDNYVRAWFWGALIIILTFVALIMLCVFYCCACACCCGKKLYRKTYKGPMIGCALFTITMIALAIILLCVSLWLETEVDNSIANYFNSNLTNGSDVSLVITLEFYRFRVALGFLSVVIFILFISLFGFACAPSCKSPAAIILFMVIYLILALLISVYACITFVIIVFVSDVCVDIYNDLGSSLCSDIGTFSTQLDTFCNDVPVDGFTIVILSCATIIILCSLQIFGTIYANLVTRSKYTNVETVGQSSEIFISSPLTAGGTKVGGVWNEYGAQTVLGVKSRGQDIPSGYSPEAYPMGAVAPVAPIAALPTDDQFGIKEITLRMKEVEVSTDSSNNDVHIVDI